MKSRPAVTVRARVALPVQPVPGVTYARARVRSRPKVLVMLAETAPSGRSAQSEPDPAPVWTEPRYAWARLLRPASAGA